MRFLHSADWHLGKLFYGQHVTNDQAHVLEEQFLPLLKEAKIDAILLCGDVFDRAVPPVEAMELWNLIITRVAKEYKIPFIVIGGNHDSAERLNMGRELFAEVGLFMEGGIRRDLKSLYFEDVHGPIYLCPLPFCEPHTVRSTYEVDYTTTYEEAYAYALQCICESMPPMRERRSIAMSHCFLTGGTSCESERTLSVGGADQVSKSLFDAFHYTALGHLHGPQTFRGKRGPIRYSGSLLKYSFDEANQHKSFTIVDMDQSGSVSLEEIPIEAKHDVRIIRGTFEDLQGGSLYKQQIAKGLSVDDYLLAEITDEGPIIDALSRLRRFYPQIRAINPVGRMKATKVEERIVYKELNEQELFGQFAKAIWDEALTTEENEYIHRVWMRSIKEDT